MILILQQDIIIFLQLYHLIKLLWCCLYIAAFTFTARCASYFLDSYPDYTKMIRLQ